MWKTNLKVLALALIVVGFYTTVAHIIPQLQSEVPEALALGTSVTPEQLVAAGEKIFNGAGGCTACHGLGTRAPNLITDYKGQGAIGARCGTRKPGMDCKAYLYESLTKPQAYIVAGFDPIMPEMQKQLSEDQIWAAVAFLESQGGTVDVTGGRHQADVSCAGGWRRRARTSRSSADGDARPGEAVQREGLHRLSPARRQGRRRSVRHGITSAAGASAASIRKKILNPSSDTTKGYEKFAGTMPGTFGHDAHRRAVGGARHLPREQEMTRIRFVLRHPVLAGRDSVGRRLSHVHGRRPVRLPIRILAAPVRPVPRSVVLQYMFIAHRRRADLREQRRAAVAAVQAAAPRDARRPGQALAAPRAARRRARAARFRDLSTDAPARRRADRAALDPPCSAGTDHLPRKDDRSSRASRIRCARRARWRIICARDGASTTQNCIACHGDHLDGQGHFAHGFSPSPANFSDNGTIAQLTESYVFWRIAKGGPGLPREGTPWNSAMPVWENYLTEDEIWSVVIFLYDQTGWQPRRWEATPEEQKNPTGTKQPTAPATARSAK